MDMLSVIVPVYNSIKYIKKCLLSISMQTYNNLEIIVIDDGSTDGSVELCKEFAAKDTRIHIFEQEHAGVTLARKKGICKANGEYVTFVDSDDWIEADYFENMMQKSDSADVVIALRIVWEGEKKKKCFTLSKSVEEGMYEEKQREHIWRKMLPVIDSNDSIAWRLWDKIFKTELLKQGLDNIPNDIYWGEDFCICVQAMLQSSGIKIVDASGYHYHVNDSSITNVSYNNLLMNWQHVYQCVHSLIISKVQNENSAELLERLDIFMVLMFRQECFKFFGSLHKTTELFYYYPYYGRLINSRIVLYGAGNVGQSYYRQIMQDGESIIVAWIDKDFHKYRAEGFDVCAVDSLSELYYDYVIIALYNEDSAMAVKKSLIKSGIPENIILWNKTKKV